MYTYNFKIPNYYKIVMKKQQVLSDSNDLCNSVLKNFYSVKSIERDEESIDSPLLKRRKKSTSEIAYEKFTESTLNNAGFVEPSQELKNSDINQRVTVSSNILIKIQNIENKLAATESVWTNALKQLTALHELAESVKKTNEKCNKALLCNHKILIILPTLPVKTIEELIEFDKAVSNSDLVTQRVRSILEDGDDNKYHDSHIKFVKWNIGKLFTPEVAKCVSWSNKSRYQLKNSAFIKILIKRISTKFPMLSYIYIVEQILAVLNEFHSTNQKIETCFNKQLY